MADNNIPVPDPSVLTTDQLRRELAALRDNIEVRLHGMDKAAELLHDSVMKAPTDTDKQVLHLKALNEEKFTSISKQFEERDVRSRASESAANTAVNAALSAQKEAASAQNEANAAAITKSEAATVKQIDGILALLASNTKAIDEKIFSINGRLDRGEGNEKGTTSTVTMIVAIIAVAAALFGVAVSFLGNRPSPPPQATHQQQ
jgi:cobalamin biosynthesis Mg chelatase CobN